MSPRAFDRIMVDLEAGGNAKLGRLTDAEFRCHVTGVLPLAAKSPIRGRLLVGEHKVEAGDIARQARMSVPLAQRTLAKLRHLGIVEPDDELGCELVHDFEEWNPPPKRDRTNAERQARYRERMADRYSASRNAVTNDPVTPSRALKGREEKRITATSSRPRSAVEEDSSPQVIALCELLASLIVANDPKANPSPQNKTWRDAARLLLTKDGRDADEAAIVIRWCQADEFWRSNILSMAKLREKYPQLLLRMSAVSNGRAESHAEVTRRRLESVKRLGGFHAQ